MEFNASTTKAVRGNFKNANPIMLLPHFETSSASPSGLGKSPFQTQTSDLALPTSHLILTPSPCPCLSSLGCSFSLDAFAQVSSWLSSSVHSGPTRMPCHSLWGKEATGPMCLISLVSLATLWCFSVIFMVGLLSPSSYPPPEHKLHESKDILHPVHCCILRD